MTAKMSRRRLRPQSTLLLEMSKPRGRGRDFHLQVKISAEDHNMPCTMEGKGNTLADTIQICKWLEQNGVDAIHVFPEACSHIREIPRARSP